MKKIKTLLGNAFALSMVTGFDACNLNIKKVTVQEVRSLLSNGFESVVGHQSTADLFTSMLDIDVNMNRVSVSLDTDTLLIVGQYSGPRLPEGVTQLPEGASITWYTVQVAK
ncbi:MAG: DUF1874 domain-containing protein [Planctomycetota bacterium]|nr:MAG: DUF1874 domain-containing protein [Planctomycetota bacterium]